MNGRDTYLLLKPILIRIASRKFRPIPLCSYLSLNTPKKKVPFPFFLSLKKSKITCNRDQLKAIKDLFRTLKKLPEWKNVWTMKAASVLKWSQKMAAIPSGPIAFVGPVWQTTSNKMVYQAKDIPLFFRQPLNNALHLKNIP